MPLVPTYDADEKLDPGREPSVNYDTSRYQAQAAQGREIEKFGATIEELGQHAAARQEQQDALRASIGLQSLNESISASDKQASTNMPADGVGWTQSRYANAQQLTQGFLGTLSPGMQEKYGLRAGLMLQKYQNDYAEQEIKANQKYLTNQVSEQHQKTANSLYANDPSVEGYNAAVAQSNHEIDNLPLPAEQREEMKQKVQVDLAQASLRGAEMRRARELAQQKVGVVGPGGVYSKPPADQGMPGTPSGPAPIRPDFSGKAGAASDVPVPPSPSQAGETRTVPATLPESSAKPVVGKISYDGDGATVNGTRFTQPANPVEIAQKFTGMGEASHKEVVAEFIRKSGGHDIDPAQIPWCGAFVDAVLGASGRQTANTMRAGDFLQYGAETKNPTKGDIVVFGRNGEAAHVGLVIGVEGDKVRYIAGNDSHKVRENTAATSTVMGYRHPPEAPTGGVQQPKMQGTIPNRQAISVSGSERDLLIRTIYGEAAGESDVGKSAVAHIIANRVASGQYGGSVQSVIMAPKQFSLWNPGDKAGDLARRLDPNSGVYQRIGAIADAALSGKSPDPTNGADHYYNPKAASPDWGPKLAAQNDVTIGNHRFVGKSNSAGTQKAEIPGSVGSTIEPARMGLDPNDPRLAAIPWQARRAIETDAMNEAVRFQTQQNAAVLQQHNAYMDTVKLAAHDGKYGLTELQNDRSSGRISTFKDIEQVEQVINKRNGDQQDINNFSDALARGSAFNPADKTHQKMVDAGYDAAAKLSGDPIGATQRIVERTGMVPTQAMTSLRGALISGDAGQAQRALGITANILKTNPNILDAMPGGEKLAKQADAFRHFTDDMGMSPKDATARVVEQETPEFKRKLAQELKGQSLDDVVKQNLSPSDLEKAFNVGFPYLGRPSVSGQVPKVQSELLGDYEDWFKIRYQESGDVGLAKTAAIADVKKVWGVSNLTGKQVFTRYPLELAPAYAGIEDISTKAADAAVAEIKTNTGKDVSRDRIVVTAGPYTPDAFRSGKAPPMVLGWTDAQGHFQLSPRPFVVDPDVIGWKQTEMRRQRFNQKREFDMPLLQNPEQQLGNSFGQGP